MGWLTCETVDLSPTLSTPGYACVHCDAARRLNPGKVQVGMRQSDVDRIKNERARQRLQQAFDYKSAIDQFVGLLPGEAQAALKQAVDETDTWMDLMLELADAIDLYEANPVLKQKLGSLPSELEKLRRGLDKETDLNIKGQLQRNIDEMKRQLDKLQTIEAGVIQADERLDLLLAQLGKLHALTQVPPDSQA
jgi:hypothetical protein